jgi:carboxyl-terminal processing protease
MKKNVKVKVNYAVVYIVLIFFGFVLGINAHGFMGRAQAAIWESNWGLLYQVLDIVKTQYIDKDLEDQKLIYGSIKGMLKSLDDPYTRFIEPKSFEEMQIRMDGKFAGVGIQIGIKDDILTVIAPIEGTPAFRAGMKAMDRIIKVDDIETDNMSLEEAVSKIRGPRGTKVTLTIIRKNKKEPIPIDIVRDIINIKSVPKVKMVDKKKKIGYIQLATFENKTSPQEVEDAIATLNAKGMKALILDVRNNGGGLLRNAVDIASFFIEEGSVVHTVDRDGNKDTLEVVSVPSNYYKKPIVILINHGSASASEILAGAIRDRKRGQIIGTNSFGKASVQNVRPLSDGSAVLVTIAKYLTPDGTDINANGITPNIIIEIPTANIEAAQEEGYEYKEEDDVQLQKAIEVLGKELK